MAHKLVIVVRADLDIGKGKLAAQVGHASVSAALNAQKNDSRAFKAWMADGQAKVVVKVDGLRELYEVKERAADAGFSTNVVSDAGHTQLPPGTVTCMAVGPEAEDKLDTVTGHLKLM